LASVYALVIGILGGIIEMYSTSRSFKLSLLASLAIAAPLWGQNNMSLTCPATANAGTAVACTVKLALQSGVTADSGDFTVAITPGGGAPAATSLTYTDVAGGGLKQAGAT
jgi:hypothetical protein